MNRIAMNAAEWSVCPHLYSCLRCRCHRSCCVEFHSMSGCLLSCHISVLRTTNDFFNWFSQCVFFILNVVTIARWHASGNTFHLCNISNLQLINYLCIMCPRVSSSFSCLMGLILSTQVSDIRGSLNAPKRKTVSSSNYITMQQWKS